MENKKIQKAKGVIENKILERIMRELSRAIVYKDGGCREVNSCSQCGNFDVYYKKDGCGFGVLTFSCAELCLMLMCDRWDERVAIIDYNSISGNCPLPLWDRIKTHAPDEFPEPNEDLIIKYRRKREQPCTVTGFRGKENWYLLSTHRGFSDDIKVISWEYLKKMEKDDE